MGVGCCVSPVDDIERSSSFIPEKKVICESPVYKDKVNLKE